MRHVLVTGAGRRIGACIARAFAADGWGVIAHYRRSRADAEKLQSAIAAHGGRCDLVQADLADRGDIAGLIAGCVERFGGLDMLVNNAGSFGYDTLATMDLASWDAHLRPNLEAPLFLAQAFARARGGQSGTVINILDHKVTAPNPDFFTYSVTKLAMAGATRLLAQALGQNGGKVRVNGIAPGITLLSGKQSPAGFARAWAAPPLGRSSTPEEIAEACRFILATPSLNGQILVLDGGDSLLERQRDIAFDISGDQGGVPT